MQQIHEAGGYYVAALKGNQGLLYEQVKDCFEQAQATNWLGLDYSYHETVNRGHHRREIRRVWVIPVSQLPLLHRQEQWAGLTTVVMVWSQRHLWNKTTTEVRFYISSLDADAKRHNQVIRSHWSIENSLHWVWDVTFHEDASRIRCGYAAENIGLLRRLGVNLLKGEPSGVSLNMKRYKAAMDNSFLLKILEASVHK